MAFATHAETTETILNSSCPIEVDESANALPPDEFKPTPIPLPYRNHIHNELTPLGEATASAYVGDVDETLIAMTCVDVLNHEVPVTDDVAELIVNASADRDLMQNLCLASNCMNETVEVVQVDLEENMSSKPNDNTVAVESCNRPDLLKEIKPGHLDIEEITHQLEVCRDQGPPVSVNKDNESGCDICDSRDSTIELVTDNSPELENHSTKMDDFVEQKEVEVTISLQTIDTNFDGSAVDKKIPSNNVLIPEKAINTLPLVTPNGTRHDLLKEIKPGHLDIEEITYQREASDDQGAPVSVNNDDESGCDICDSRDSTIELDSDNSPELENHSKQLDDFVEQKELEVTISPHPIDTNFDDSAVNEKIPSNTVSIPKKALNVLPRATVNPQIRTSTGGKKPDKFAGTKVGVSSPRVATRHTSSTKPHRIENGNTHSQQKNPRARTCTALPRVAMLYKTIQPSLNGKRTKESRGDLSLIIRRNGSHVYTSNFVEKHDTTGASSPYTRSVPPAAMEDERLRVPPFKAPMIRESDGGAACPDVLLREGALEEAAVDKYNFAAIAAVGSNVSPTDVRKLDSITDTNNAMVPTNLDTTAF
jgi:hypothetical protein